VPSLTRSVDPLRHRGYRQLAASLGLTLFAAGLWLVAVVWQVVALGGGPGALSLVATGAAVGMVASTLLGGALADRIPQRRILAAVEVTRAAAVGVVAVLALTGAVQVWMLTVVAVVGGIAEGLYYPAYSALLPAILPADALLAANGLEGVLRPVLLQAAGPAAASGLVAVLSPGAALALSAVASLGGAVVVLRLAETPVRRDLAQEDRGHAVVAGMVRDVLGGFRYMVATPWLLGTLLFACFTTLVMIGPFEVLVPFALKDRAGGGPGDHAFVLAAFGIGGAVASLVVGSLRLPRRYLTVMNVSWALGCVPLVVFGLARSVWPMVVAAALLGALSSVGMVIWGTLLQRRVPPELLGRVASLDFFVSLVFMPVSMALAGSIGQQVPIEVVFAVAGVVPVGLAVAALVVFRMPADEIAHPLDVVPVEP
jgi:MFS family permease